MELGEGVELFKFAKVIRLEQCLRRECCCHGQGEGGVFDAVKVMRQTQIFGKGPSDY
jgi:hypothetical protein